jgi:predicted DNA-binding protein with PD1-like motif
MVTADLLEARTGRLFVGRLETGSDLVEEIQAFCLERSIVAGWVDAVGAMQHVRYAYYDQNAKRYVELESETHHEMAAFAGNVSDRDGKPFLHAHATFAEESGATIGGHLLPGCKVWVAELRITELADVSLVRTFDERTALALW